MASGRVVIGFDGSPGSDRAIQEAGELLAPRAALVVVVWKRGLGFALMENPASTLGLPPAELDISAALEVDEAMRERAQRLAEQGAAIARDAGLEAESLVAADDVDTPVAETLVRVARDRGAHGIVVARHPKGRAADWILGSTTRDVIRHADRPVVVVRTGPD